MKLLVPALFVLSVFTAQAQINLEDSTVQVIGFWDRNEKQSYSVSHEKYKVNGSDTAARELMKYDVEITIKDSTANSYTIEWFYRNYSTNSQSTLVQKMLAVSEDVKVLIKTDEFGAIREVVNWKEVRDHIRKATATMRKELKDIPNMDGIVSQVENLYSTEGVIRSHAILDAQQFYSFHAGKYKLGEVLEGQLKTANLYGPEPFDTDVTVYLDEINDEDNNYIMRSTQIVNPQQLTDATWSFLSEMAKKMGKPGPKREDLNNLSNETATASRIHGSGWVVYSIQTKTVTLDKTQTVEERIIEIK